VNTSRLLLVAGFLLVAAVAQATYVVILRSGARVVAREKYQVKGNNAVLTLKNGTLTSIPLNQIDMAATEKLNARNLGDATPLDWVDSSIIPPTATPTPSVGSLGAIRANAARPEADGGKPTPTPGISFRDRAYKDPQVDKAFQEGFESYHLYLYRTSEGTDPAHYFVEVQVNGQPEVLKALQAVSTTYHLLVQTAPDRAPAKVEVQMLNESGKEAGVFRFGSAEASDLVNGKLTPQEFYLKYVIF
jgi:hypothetical protein